MADQLMKRMYRVNVCIYIFLYCSESVCVRVQFYLGDIVPCAYKFTLGTIEMYIEDDVCSPLYVVCSLNLGTKNFMLCYK